MIVPQNQLANVVATEWAIRASAAEKVSLRFSHQRTDVTPGPATAEAAIPCGGRLDGQRHEQRVAKLRVPHQILEVARRIEAEHLVVVPHRVAGKGPDGLRHVEAWQPRLEHELA